MNEYPLFKLSVSSITMQLLSIKTEVSAILYSVSIKIHNTIYNSKIWRDKQTSASESETSNRVTSSE